MYGINDNGKGDYVSAINWFKKAYAIDSNDIHPVGWLTGAYVGALLKNVSLEGEAKKWCLKLYSKRDMVDLRSNLMQNIIIPDFWERPEKISKY
jgi:hypothetical protein